MVASDYPKKIYLLVHVCRLHQMWGDIDVNMDEVRLRGLGLTLDHYPGGGGVRGGGILWRRLSGLCAMPSSGCLMSPENLLQIDNIQPISPFNPSNKTRPGVSGIRHNGRSSARARGCLLLLPLWALCNFAIVPVHSVLSGAPWEAAPRRRDGREGREHSAALRVADLGLPAHPVTSTRV